MIFSLVSTHTATRRSGVCVRGSDGYTSCGGGRMDPLTIIVHHRQMFNHIGGAQPGNKVVGLVWGSLVCGPLNTRTDKQLLQVLALNC